MSFLLDASREAKLNNKIIDCVILLLHKNDAYDAGMAPGFADEGSRLPDRGLYNRIEGIFLSIRLQFSVENSPIGVKIFSGGGGPSGATPVTMRLLQELGNTWSINASNLRAFKIN